MTKPSILVLAGSTRSGSFNRKLAAEAAKRIDPARAEVLHIELSDYPLPLYDGDREAEEGIPQPAYDLHRLLRESAGVFIASPEYNANVTPLLLNVLAWVSRIRDHGGMAAAFGHPVFALGSASPGGFGGYRGLMALRHSLELQLGALVLPHMVSVPSAHEAFDEAGALLSDRTKAMLDALMTSLIEYAERR